MTTIYLIRHSHVLFPNDVFNSDPYQIRNEKFVLSVEGEELAKKSLDIDELKNLDYLVSSSYARAISTAKYLAYYNNIQLNIIETFGERKFGVNDFKELPQDFFDKQLTDPDYKIGLGESQNEVRKRMLESLNKILDENENKRVAIVAHSTCILFLLLNWCQIKNDFLYFNNKSIGEKPIDYCNIFKLTFDKNNLLSIERI